MKFPSLNYLAKHANQAFIRFPLTILCSIIAVVIGIYLVEYENEVENIFPLLNLILAASLGIPTFFIVSIIASNYPTKKQVKWIGNAIAFIFLALIYCTLPNSELTNSTNVPYIRYTIYNIIAHLVVSFIPFLNKGNLNGFWNYNKLLFLRFLTALLYSSFLYVGLALALGSLDWLFDIDLHSELFFEIFLVIGGIFNTWFFVAGIPDNIDEQEHITLYPKGLKVFTQYVLVPLLILYLIILYVYGGKIVILQNWPKGLVAYLISGVATLGIFTLLLIYPYGKENENSWIKKFTSAYYYLLIPLIVLLFYAIFIRINDYGITINRYIIVLLGIWLSMVSLYFIFNKKNIKFIPISLALLLGLMSFGPWGMFSVSEKSQLNRLKFILENSKILSNQKVENETIWSLDSNHHFISENKETNINLISDSLNNEVYSILNYLEDSHGFNGIKGWYSQNLDSLIKVSKVKRRYLSEARIYMESLGLKHYYRWDSNQPKTTYNSYELKDHAVKNIAGYDFSIPLKEYRVWYGKQELNFSIDSLPFKLILNKSLPEHYQLTTNNDSLIFNLAEIGEQLKEKYGDENRHDLEAIDLSISSANEFMKAKIILDEINFETKNDTTILNTLK